MQEKQRKRSVSGFFRRIATVLKCGWKFFCGLSSVLKAVVIVAVIAVFAFFPALISKKPRILSTAQLQKVVDVSELSTFEIVYNGIAFKYNDKKPEKEDYKVRYEATVKVGANMSDIQFEVDDENKVLKATLPAIVINDLDVNPGTMDYMPENTMADFSEAYELCKADVELEVSENSDKMLKNARENLEMAIQALLTPVLTAEGYELVFTDQYE
mgnify:CR=1 FL=1